MMLRKLLTNKKIVIITLSVLLFVIVGIVIFVTTNSIETGKNDTNPKEEQMMENTDTKGDKTDTDDKEDSQGNGSSQLEILEPDEVVPENSSDASGSWDNTSDSNTQSGNSNTTNKTEQTENKDPNEKKEDDGEDQEKDEGILEDDITWGNIY